MNEKKKHPTLMELLDPVNKTKLEDFKKIEKKPKSNTLKKINERIEIFREKEIQKQEKIQNLQIQQFENELNELSKAPKIDKYSKKILENRDYKSLSIRTKEILEKKNKFINEKLKEKIKIQEDEIKNLNFTPYLNVKSKKSRTFHEFFDSITNWQIKREDHIEKIKNENLKSELCQSFLKPKILEIKKTFKDIESIPNKNITNIEIEFIDDNNKRENNEKNKIDKIDKSKFKQSNKINYPDVSKLTVAFFEDLNEPNKKIIRRKEVKEKLKNFNSKNINDLIYHNLMSNLIKKK